MANRLRILRGARNEGVGCEFVARRLEELRCGVDADERRAKVVAERMEECRETGQHVLRLLTRDLSFPMPREKLRPCCGKFSDKISVVLQHH
jgi:hypothetical protein